MRIHSSVLLLSGLLVGCGDSPISDGQLILCSTASPASGETGVELAGVVSALNDGSVDCSESVTLVGEDDAVLTVGFTVLDENGDDVTPALDLAVDEGGQEINDNINNVICYEELAKGVEKIVDQGHVNLVETLAEIIATMCLSDVRVRSALVRVEKLDILEGAESVGVEIERFNSEV